MSRTKAVFLRDASTHSRQILSVAKATIDFLYTISGCRPSVHKYITSPKVEHRCVNEIFVNVNMEYSNYLKC